MVQVGCATLSLNKTGGSLFSSVKRVLVVVFVAAVLAGGSAIALAQSSTTPVDVDAPAELEEVQFIGDPPGNDQTGEWDGEYEYEG
jgi:hypothetical protein